MNINMVYYGVIDPSADYIPLCSSTSPDAPIYYSKISMRPEMVGCSYCTTKNETDVSHCLACGAPLP
jgi:hypothetical protein